MAPKVLSAWREFFETVVVCVLSAAFGVALTAGLAATADANNWCCVHTWALAHGSGAVVFLLFALVGYHVVRTIGGRLGLLTPAPQFGALAHSAYVFGALGTLIFTEPLMWLGLGAGLVALTRHFSGRSVRPFGLAVVGFFTSLLSVGSWAYLQWLVHISVG